MCKVLGYPVPRMQGGATLPEVQPSSPGADTEWCWALSWVSCPMEFQGSLTTFLHLPYLSKGHRGRNREIHEGLKNFILLANAGML